MPAGRAERSARFAFSFTFYVSDRHTDRDEDGVGLCRYSVRNTVKLCFDHCESNSDRNAVQLWD